MQLIRIPPDPRLLTLQASIAGSVGLVLRMRSCKEKMQPKVLQMRLVNCRSLA